MAVGTPPPKTLGKAASGEAKRRLRLRRSLWVLMAIVGFIAAAVAVRLIFFPADHSPIVDPKKRPLIEAARAEFAVPSNYELSKLGTSPAEIADETLTSVASESVEVVICPETQVDGCDANSIGARHFFLHHVIQYGRDDRSDIYDFVFRRRDHSSLSASQQEFRYRTSGSGGALAALVIRPTDWNRELRLNQVAYLPAFLNTELGEFLFANRQVDEVQEWGNVAGILATCVGYCPVPTPSLGDRITTLMNTAVAYLETDSGRNFVLALCAIIGALLAILTFLLRRAEYAFLRKQVQADAQSPRETDQLHNQSSGRMTSSPPRRHASR